MFDYWQQVTGHRDIRCYTGQMPTPSREPFPFGDTITVTGFAPHFFTPATLYSFAARKLTPVDGERLIDRAAITLRYYKAVQPITPCAQPSSHDHDLKTRTPIGSNCASTNE